MLFLAQSMGHDIEKHVQLNQLLTGQPQEVILGSLLDVLVKKLKFSEQDYELAKELLRVLKAMPDTHSKQSALAGLKAQLLQPGEIATKHPEELAYKFLLQVSLEENLDSLPVTLMTVKTPLEQKNFYSCLARQVAKNLLEELLDSKQALSLGVLMNKKEVVFCYKCHCEGSLWASVVSSLLEMPIFSPRVHLFTSIIMTSLLGDITKDPVELRKCKNFFKEAVRRDISLQESFPALHEKLLLAKNISEEFYQELLISISKNIHNAPRFFTSYLGHQAPGMAHLQANSGQVAIHDNMNSEEIAHVVIAFTSRGHLGKQTIIGKVAALTNKALKENLALVLIGSLTTEHQLEQLTHEDGLSLLRSMCEGSGIDHHSKEISWLYKRLALVWYPDKITDEERKKKADIFMRGLTPLRDFLLRH